MWFENRPIYRIRAWNLSTAQLDEALVHSLERPMLIALGGEEVK